jgi:Leucine-rich repeat (LRR) protein
MITICGKEYSVDTSGLFLSNQGLTAIPEEIKYLTNLEYLSLSQNKITMIPEHIFDHLTNLKSLYLYNNKITAIPEHIFDQLINLKQLYLNNNKITSIPEHLFDSLTNLKHLSLSDNEITAIPEHLFDSLTNLKYLSLSDNEITAIPEHLFDSLITLKDLNLSRNQITTIPISVLNCRRLIHFKFDGNPIERIDVRIQRFIDNLNPKTLDFFSDFENVHSSVKDSINSLMKDSFTMDKKDIIQQLMEESPICMQSLLCYLDDKDIHSTLYLTFFEVFEKVWGRIIGSDFKVDLIKRLDEEMMDSECYCFTDRISHLLNVLAGFFSDINITISNNERIVTFISSVLNGREMSDELKELCRKSLKEAEIEDDEIDEWLDMKIIL